MEMTGDPDEVVAHEPGACAGCGKGLFGSMVTGAERRQVVDLPEEVRALVILAACPAFDIIRAA